MSDTTRIMDLPENITIQSTGGAAGFSTSYTPIDVHPNPYGHPPPSVPSIPTPSYSQPQQQQRLPSRDIPSSTQSVQYTQDEQIQPNYIPSIPVTAKNTAEYMKQFEAATERKINAHLQEKQKQTRWDLLVEQGQIPLLVALLFYIFHMPIVNRLMFKNLSFLSIYDIDGNFNTYGLIFKSLCFGGLFYGVSQIVHYFSEI